MFHIDGFSFATFSHGTPYFQVSKITIKWVQKAQVFFVGFKPDDIVVCESYTTTMDPIVVQEVKSSRDLSRFIKFPFDLYRNDPGFTPPLFQDEKAYFNKNQNIYLRQNPFILLAAFENGKMVGRAMGLINREANVLRQENLARFTWLDTNDDFKVFSALVGRLEDWAKAHKVQALVGPRGFSDQEPQGVLCEGFETRSSIGTIYARPYFSSFIEKLGYSKEVDWVSYQFPLKVLKNLPFSCDNFHEIKVKGKIARLVQLRSKKDLKKYLIPVFRCLNETYSQLYGFHAITEEEMHAAAKKYLPVLDPNLIKIYELEGEVVAFIVAMADIAEALKKSNGRLLPLGFIRLLRALKNSEILQMLLFGVKPQYQRSQLVAGLLHALNDYVQTKNFKILDSHLNLENNYAVRKWLERLGGSVHKRYRVYRKELGTS